MTQSTLGCHSLRQRSNERQAVCQVSRRKWDLFKVRPCVLLALVLKISSGKKRKLERSGGKDRRPWSLVPGRIHPILLTGPLTSPGHPAQPPSLYSGPVIHPKSQLMSVRWFGGQEFTHPRLSWSKPLACPSARGKPEAYSTGILSLRLRFNGQKFTHSKANDQLSGKLTAGGG